MTRFRGVEFPSTTHAQWALFFDDLHVTWTFRPMRFAVGEGATFEPDFWLPRDRVWFHIGIREDTTDHHRWAQFARSADDAPCPARQLFIPGMACPVHGHHALPLATPEWQATRILYYRADIAVPAQTRAAGPIRSYHDSMLTLHGSRYRWTRCPECGSAGVTGDGRAENLPCAHGDQRTDQSTRADDPRISAAYRLARQTQTAGLPGKCARCETALRPGDLIGAGRHIAGRRWYHADCLLAGRRERARFDTSGAATEPPTVRDTAAGSSTGDARR